MSPYRISTPPTELTTTRWGVSRYKRWYVRLARIFFDLRGPHMYSRQYRKYQSQLRDWEALRDLELRKPLRNWKSIPIVPLPPPSPILE